MLKADGFDEAILGVAVRFTGDPVVAYDYRACVDILIARGATRLEAEEYMDFNVVGAWHGPETPVFVVKPEDGEPMDDLIERFDQ